MKERGSEQKKKREKRRKQERRKLEKREGVAPVTREKHSLYQL